MKDLNHFRHTVRDYMRLVVLCHGSMAIITPRQLTPHYTLRFPYKSSACSSSPTFVSSRWAFAAFTIVVVQVRVGKVEVVGEPSSGARLVQNRAPLFAEVRQTAVPHSKVKDNGVSCVGFQRNPVRHQVGARCVLAQMAPRPKLRGAAHQWRLTHGQKQLQGVGWNMSC